MSRPAYGVVDAFVNPVLPADGFVHEVAEVFGAGDELLRRRSADELLADMDAAGVERALLTCWTDPQPVLETAAAAPDRFALSAIVDPRRGMATVREVERLVVEHGVRLVRAVPFLLDLPPNDRAYYPLYAKCVELGVPVSVTTGIPAPAMPAEPQRPLHLDDVCRFFPELTVVMAHGADPWWGEAIRLVAKYPNLHLMTSAWPPSALPEQLVRFMAGKGAGKVVFATDYPTLSMQRCVEQASRLPLEADQMRAYLRDTALRLFWPEGTS